MSRAGRWQVESTLLAILGEFMLDYGEPIVRGPDKVGDCAALSMRQLSRIRVPFVSPFRPFRCFAWSRAVPRAVVRVRHLDLDMPSRLGWWCWGVGRPDAPGIFLGGMCTLCYAASFPALLLSPLRAQAWWTSSK